MKIFYQKNEKKEWEKADSSPGVGTTNKFKSPTQLNQTSIRRLT